MSGNTNNELYLSYLNQSVLPRISYRKLQASYDSDDKLYANVVLATLHHAFTRIHGTNFIDETICPDTVILPAVIRSQDTGNLCIGLVTLDMSSSGEHWYTGFLSEYGIVADDTTDKGELRDYVDRFIPYDYWYTPRVKGDIHVDCTKAPPEVKQMLNATTMDPKALAAALKQQSSHER